MKRILIFFFLYLLGFVCAVSSSQIPDLCVFTEEGKQDTLVGYVYPLEDLLDKEEHLKSFKSCDAPSCLRGYQAVWSVVNDSLFLMKIKGCNAHMSWCEEETEMDLSKLFGSRCVNNKVFADWFGGDFRLFAETQIPWIEEILFPKDVVLLIEKGRVVNKTIYENIKGCKSAFKIELNTPSFLVFFLQNNINWDAFPQGVTDWIAILNLEFDEKGFLRASLSRNEKIEQEDLISREINRCFEKTKWVQYFQWNKPIRVSMKMRISVNSEQKIIRLIH